LLALALMTGLLPGCNPGSNPPTGAGPPAGGGIRQGKAENGSAAGGVKQTDLEWVDRTAAPGSGGGPMPPGVNRIINGSGSHTFKATMDVSVSSDMEGERAVIDFGGRRLVIDFDKRQVLLDGLERAKLPAGTKEVEVQFVGGKFSMTADGAAVMPTGTSTP
jgi:hypothetical protein